MLHGLHLGASNEYHNVCFHGEIKNILSVAMVMTVLQSKSSYKEKLLHYNIFITRVRYNMVLDITRFKDGSQNCIDYIEK